VSSNAAASTEIMPSASTVIERADNNSSQFQREFRSSIESTSSSHVQSDCCNTDSCAAKPIINDNNAVRMLLLQADDCQTLTHELPVSTKLVIQQQSDGSQKSSLTRLSINGNNTIIHKTLSSTKLSNSSKTLPTQISDKMPVAWSSGLIADNNTKQSDTLIDVKDNAEGRSNRYVFSITIVYCHQFSNGNSAQRIESHKYVLSFVSLENCFII